MTLMPSNTTLSAAVFSPQSSPPPSTHLSYIRTRLLEDPSLEPLKDAIVNLPETWQALTASRQDDSRLELASKAIGSFPQWIETGESDVLEQDMSGIITLPLLTTIHIVQYLSFIRGAGLSHSDFLRSVVQRGGVQGYCIGLLSAVIVAASRDEQELVQHAVAGLHLSLAIGAFGDLGQASSASSLTRTLQISLRHQDDVHEILGRFPTVRSPSPTVSSHL